MARRDSEDLQGLETGSSGTLVCLNSVVQWLHQEGFYGAEAALLREVELRFPDHASSPSRTPGGSPVRPAGGSTLPPSLDFSPSAPMPELGTRQGGMLGVERVLEAWRSKSGTPAASPRDPVGLPPRSPATPREGVSATGISDIDEYDDDDDAGFWRIDIQGQNLQLTTELELRCADSTDQDGGFPYSYPLSPSPSAASLGGAPQDTPQREGSLDVPPLLMPPVGLPARPSPTAAPTSAARQGREAGSTVARNLAALGSPSQQQPQQLPRMRSLAAAVHGSPNSSENVVVSPFRSSTAGSPGIPPVCPPPPPSYSHVSEAQRQAGTANWVYDRSNSAGSEAYKSLLTFLEESPRLHSTPTPPRSPPSAGADPVALRQGSTPTTGRSNEVEVELEPEAEASASDLPNIRSSQGRVPSLSESVLQEAVAGALAERERCDAAASSAAAADSAELAAKPQTGASPVPALRALRMSGDAATRDSVRSAASNAVETNDTVRGSSPESHVGSSAAEEPSQRNRDDPFSFPVTSPSERRQSAAAAPLFGSWPSFKALGGAGSPPRSLHIPEYCSAEEEVPGFGTRRLHRKQGSVASSLGGLQGPALLPSSLPAAGAAARFLGLRRAHSHSGLSASIRSPGQYDDLALYQYDEDAIEGRYEVFDLRVIHRRNATGFEHSRELALRVDDLIAGRYQIVDLLGQAAFSRAVAALDLKTGMLVCLKVVKNNKDYLDQSLDEIKLLRYVNAADPHDDKGILRLYDFFYFKEHLILVCELLRANLYEFSRHLRDAGDAPYFTPPRIQSVARQVLRSLTFLHSLGLLHADLKPENILMKSYSACEVKVIDLGSSCFLTDRLSSYIQSRSYRAPEVILGLPYGQKVDVWSLGCVVAELASGRVLFHNTSLPSILARVEGILGPLPKRLVQRGRYGHRYYTHDGRLYERNKQSGRFEYLQPKRTSLARRVPEADAGMLDFLSCLLQVDPSRRPSAAEALQHPWLQHQY